MASERERTVLALYAIFASETLDGIDELVHPEFVADWSRSHGPMAGIYDRARLGDLHATLHDAFVDIHWEPAEAIALGDDRLLLVNRFAGRGRGSGVPFSASGAQLWTFRGDRAVRAELFQTKEEALAAAARS